MYVIRVEGTVPIGRLVDFEAWIDQFFDQIKQVKGLQAATLLQSLSYPGQFTGIYRFENRSAAQSMTRDAQFNSFLQQHPLEGLFIPTRPIEGQETVVFDRGQGTFGTLTLVDVTIDLKPGNQQAFEQRTTQLLSLVQQHGRGVVVTALTRLAGSAQRYTIAYGFISMDDGQATMTSPEIARFREQNPLSQFGSAAPVGETSEVVKSLVLAGATTR